ncbi:MAG: geranylgeranylglyceryl/heptaprenylglyceryl phosphate synthase [Breznakibacter sp.]|nr:geranylgeranylglyceryl/heptaprenylglyceryl phosphate synthase [Breznakibacter sp.]
MILDSIKEKQRLGKKMIALLIDPDRTKGGDLDSLIERIQLFLPDFILVGGSLLTEDVSPVYQQLKRSLSIPLVTFPGSVNQVSNLADGILFLSLISGRNPELLIGNHVVAAPLLRKSGVEIISTGYVLVDGGVVTSVQYMSNTTPVPCNKLDIASATALAGEYLGMKLIYLEAGSGAKNPVSKEMIAAVKSTISIPLMVGGGVNTPQKLSDAFEAGADVVVVGTAIEKSPELLNEFIAVVERYR